MRPGRFRGEGGPGGCRPGPEFAGAPGERFEGRGAFGPFGPPFGGGGPGGRPGPPWARGGFGGPPPWVRGRRGGRARRGDVRASLLALLKERPMHGYEMIAEIAERSGGAWRPSPGSVYPTLQLLEEEGLVTAEEVGGKRLVQLTEAGRTEAEAGPDEPWAEAGQEVDWAAVQEVGQALGAVEQAVRQVMATGTEAQRAKGLEVLNEARKKLYLILAEDA
ncbi:PadR family transcriptional regulator [Kitasatospora sp. NPDC089913]|uniref:PadR family transcriptional regulator n=1 Tax=Streptomycetaceae TaxID=2062 RepID=UPI0008798B84|nr:PadR family transcriptional regulator [Streptomyces sp. TLI_053]SDT77556.1 transcriptional regulator, PadR family [Streptomyces sp. TLI_053]